MMWPSVTTRSSDNVGARHCAGRCGSTSNRSPCVPQHVGLHQQPRPVADRSDRLARCDEGPDQGHRELVGPQRVGVADPAGQDQARRNPSRFGLGDGQVGADRPARIVVHGRLDRRRASAQQAPPRRPRSWRIARGPNSSLSSKPSVAMIRIGHFDLGHARLLWRRNNQRARALWQSMLRFTDLSSPASPASASAATGAISTRRQAHHRPRRDRPAERHRPCRRRMKTPGSARCRRPSPGDGRRCAGPQAISLPRRFPRKRDAGK